MERIDLTQETARIRTLDKGALHRKLRTRDLFGVAYGDVGSSIIYALGVVAAFAFGATPLAIGVAGLFFIFTALTYAELGACVPEAGGAQIFARRAFNSDLISFVTGWALLLDYVLTAAISSYTIGPYLAQFFPTLAQPWAIIGLAGLLLALLAALNILGVRDSTRMSLWLTLICLATFAFIIAWGFWTVFDLGKIVDLQRQVGTKPTWDQFLNAVALAMVAYIGIEAGTQLAGEAKDPGKTVPRAIKWTVLTLLVVYMGTVAVAMSIDRLPEELGTRWKEQPLLGIASGLPEVAGWLTPWVGVLAAMVLFVATNAGLIGASRLAYSMAGHLQLPGAFQTLHPTRRTPWFSLIFFTVAAVGVLLLTQDMQSLAELYNFGSMLAFSMAHLSLIGMRIREPNLDRPYKVGFNIPVAGRQIPITALLGLLATGATWVYVIIYHPNGRWLGFGWLGVGLVLYVFFRRRQYVPFAEAVRIQKVSMPEYQPWQVRHILVPTLGGATTEVVQIACRTAAAHGAKVTALYVIEIPEAIPLETFLGGQWKRGEDALDRAEAIAREYGVEIHRKLIQARQAGPTIAEIAKEEGCDLIVIGTAPRSSSSVSLLGGTVESVVRRAPCRVMICSSVHTV